MRKQKDDEHNLVSVVERYPTKKIPVFPIIIFVVIGSLYWIFPTSEKLHVIKDKTLTHLTDSVPQQKLNSDLHQLISKGNFQKIKSHLSNTDNADINLVKNGMTPIMLASSRGDIGIIDLLFTQGADPNKRGSMQRTALLYAVEKNHLSAVKRLLSYGAEIDAFDNGRLTPLVMAASRGYSELSQFFIDKGANVDIQHRDGWTALIDATAHGDEKVVRALLMAGANTELKEKNGKTALDYAKEYGFPNLVKLLSNAG